MSILIVDAYVLTKNNGCPNLTYTVILTFCYKMAKYVDFQVEIRCAVICVLWLLNIND